jgi:Glyoxalase/Bleomycin resistance protein/Dioxygenase superfamily
VAIEALDVLYVPSRDVESDLKFYRDVLGARVAFAIEAMGTRVAEVAICPQGPRLVLAEHLAGDAPLLLHRVSDLDETLAQLSARGLRLEGRVELPLGPARLSEALAASGLVSTSSRDPRSTSISSVAPTSTEFTLRRRAKVRPLTCPEVKRLGLVPLTEVLRDG